MKTRSSIRHSSRLHRELRPHDHEKPFDNRRFDKKERAIAVPHDTMTARRTLVDTEGLERRPVADHPARFEYRLAQAANNLCPAIAFFMQWRDGYLNEVSPPPMTFTHHCERLLRFVTVHATGGESVKARDVRAVPLSERYSVHLTKRMER